MGCAPDIHEGSAPDPNAPDEVRAAGSGAETSAAGPGEVLIVGVDDWAIRDATGRMQDAGWTVHRCSDTTDTPFPCNAVIPGRGCPLNQHRVGVVLDVRSRPATELALSEMGSICGLRDRLPLILAGPAEGTSLAPWARVVPASGDLVAACQEVLEGQDRSGRDEPKTSPTAAAPTEMEGAT
jgi:hypothetical protein